MEFEAPSVWRIASKHTVTFHNLAALGLKRLAAILVDLAEVDAETPMGTRRRLGQSLEKPWLSGAELKVRIQLPPAASPVRTSPPRAPVSFARRQLRKSAIAPSGERERRIGLQNDRDRRGLGAIPSNAEQTAPN